MSHSIAVKCVYNDGDEGLLLGFNGVCSPDIMQRNVRNEQTRKQARSLIERAFGLSPAPPACGCLCDRSVHRKADMAQMRKCGDHELLPPVTLG